jgi:hypothetical protein
LILIAQKPLKGRLTVEHLPLMESSPLDQEGEEVMPDVDQFGEDSSVRGQGKGVLKAATDV